MITKITVSDGRADTADVVQDLRYSGRRFDTMRRESFGLRVAESEDAAGVVRARVFHQQPALRGRQEHAETCEGPSGGPPVACYQAEDHVWEDVLDPPGAGWYLSRPTLSVTALCDDSGDACTGPIRQRVVERTYDGQLGNLLTETDCGLDASCEPGAEADNLVRKLTWASPAAGEWLTSYVREEAIYFESIDPENLVNRVRLHYDTASYTPGAPTPPQACPGAPCGGLVSFRETLREIDPGTGAETLAVERWDHDAYGNVEAYFDPETFAALPANPTQQVVYDSTGTFPLSVQDALLEETAYRFDAGLGVVTRRLEPTGHLECWGYDGFGRLDARSESIAAFGYADIDAGVCGALLATFAFTDFGDPEAQHILETASSGAGVRGLRFFDGLGREYESAWESRRDDFDVVTRGWGVTPFVGVGPIRFGMTREEVRAVLGNGCRSFKKAPSSVSDPDAYDSIPAHFFYDSEDRLELVEVFRPATAAYEGVSLLGRSVAETIQALRERGLEPRAEGNALFYDRNGFAFIVGDDEIDGVSLFRRGYYEG